MLSRQQNFYHQLLQLVDAVLLAFTIYAAHALRYYVLNDTSGSTTRRSIRSSPIRTG